MLRNIEDIFIFKIYFFVAMILDNASLLLNSGRIALRELDSLFVHFQLERLIGSPEIIASATRAEQHIGVRGAYYFSHLSIYRSERCSSFSNLCDSCNIHSCELANKEYPVRVVLP